MKRILSGLAAVLVGGLMTSWALSSSQVGVPISDAEAATIRGGACRAVDFTACQIGSCIGIYLYQLDGDTFYNRDPNTLWNCNGNNTNCATCYKNAPTCSS